MNRRVGVAAFAIAGLAAIGMAARNYLLAGPDVAVLDVGRDFPIRDVSKEDEYVVCPWRQPDADIARFFPHPAKAVSIDEETLVFTRQRTMLAKLLGRAPTGAENALQIHRVLFRPSTGADSKTGGTPVGAIVTRYVRGESGVIELVLAVDAREQVTGARIQRLREPDSVARELESEGFLRAFRGKTYVSAWTLNPGASSAADGTVSTASVSSTSQVSAQAVLEGARVALILLHVGEQTLAARNSAAPAVSRVPVVLGVPVGR